MIKRGTFTKDVPGSIWEVSELPQGASKVRPLAVYDVNGDSHDWDSWEFQEEVLRISFGVDPVAGELEYEYQVEGDDPIIIDGNGNQVSITINQYGGGSPTDTFQ